MLEIPSVGGELISRSLLGFAELEPGFAEVEIPPSVDPPKEDMLS